MRTQCWQPVSYTHLDVYKRQVFCNVLLADEINRATPRTQSSLLECMEEKQVTVDGETRVLERPFFLIATPVSYTHLDYNVYWEYAYRYAEFI